VAVLPRRHWAVVASSPSRREGASPTNAIAKTTIENANGGNTVRLTAALQQKSAWYMVALSWHQINWDVVGPKKTSFSFSSWSSMVERAQFTIILGTARSLLVRSVNKCSPGAPSKCGFGAAAASFVDIEKSPPLSRGDRDTSGLSASSGPRDCGVWGKSRC